MKKNFKITKKNYSKLSNLVLKLGQARNLMWKLQSDIENLLTIEPASWESDRVTDLTFETSGKKIL